MMRNNMRLCRGKRKDNGEWIEGFYVCIDNERHYIFTGKKDTSGLYPTFVYYEVDPATIGQYTGETDKNGKNIFEHDIVRVDFEIEYMGLKPRPSYVGMVKYEKGAFGIYEKGKGTQFFFQHGLIKTVIGNIYDNSELTEVN